jgi:hypothetical protein
MESGMQQTTEEYGPHKEVPTERPCGLNVVEHMRMVADGHSGMTRQLLLASADEIERLKVVIESYAASAKAASEEINVLRSQVYRNRIVVVDGAVEA